MVRAGGSLAVRAAVWLHDRVMILLPDAFRVRHGAAARALFRRLAAEARVRGRLAVAGVLAAACLDVLVVAVRERWSARVLPVRHRRRRRTMFIEAVDIRHAARSLARRPGLAATVVVTLGIAIGAATTVSSIVEGVLLRPLPYADPERLHVVVTTYSGEDRGTSVSYPDFVDLRAGATRLDGLVLQGGWAAVLTGDGEPAREPGMLVSHGFFALLGVPLALGRDFLPEEQTDGRDRVVILGHGLWQRRYGGDPAAVGREIEIDGVAHTIVGVLPARLGEAGLPALGEAVIWRPLGFDGVPADQLPGRGNESYTAIARLRAGTTPAAAEAELARIAAGIATRYPDSNEGQGVVLRNLHARTVGDARTPLLILLGAVGFLLLLAVANVTGIMLARGTERVRELALRSALGADRRRLRAPALAESLLLALAGGLLGVLLAVAAVRFVVAHAGAAVPLLSQVHMDARVLAMTFVLVAGAGLATGLLTAIPGGPSSLFHWLREGDRGSAGRRRGRLRSTLIVGQIAISLLLVSGAALLMRSLWSLNRVESGFDRSTLTFRVHLPTAFYEEQTDVDAFYERLLDRIAALPGVAATGTVTSAPLSGSRACGTLFAIEDPDRFRGQDMCAEVRAVTPGYFPAMGVPFLAGRTFSTADDGDAPDVVIVSESTARLLWPGQDPLGRTLRTGFADRAHEVVGVVQDVKQHTLSAAPPPQTYLPAPQWSQWTRTVVVRADRPAAALFDEARAAVLELDARVPVTAMRTMGDYVAGSLATPRFRTALLAGFAGIALLLAAVGVYGTLSYLVSARRRELAIRRSVGARTSAVLSLVVRDGLRLAVPGIVLGASAALAVNRLLTSLLFGVSPTDPSTLGAVSLGVFAIALLACFVPALRATRVDAATILREE